MEEQWLPGEPKVELLEEENRPDEEQRSGKESETKGKFSTRNPGWSSNEVHRDVCNV